MPRKKQFSLTEQHKQFLLSVTKNRNEYMFLMEIFANRILPKETLDRMSAGYATALDLTLVNTMLNFYRGINADIAALVLRKIRPKSVRLTLVYTCDDAKIERYLFSVIYNLWKDGRKADTRYLLSLLNKYKNINTQDNSTKLKYIRIIKRVKKRVKKVLKKEEENCAEEVG